jgi:hypothetical protein
MSAATPKSLDPNGLVVVLAEEAKRVGEVICYRKVGNGGELQPFPAELIPTGWAAFPINVKS